jgi:hypothetical protein
MEGGAAKILDWFMPRSRDFSGIPEDQRAKRDLDSRYVIYADISVEGFDGLIDSRSPPVTRIRQFGLEPTEEALTGCVIGRASFA